MDFSQVAGIAITTIIVGTVLYNLAIEDHESKRWKQQLMEAGFLEGQEYFNALVTLKKGKTEAERKEIDEMSMIQVRKAYDDYKTDYAIDLANCQL